MLREKQRKIEQKEMLQHEKFDQFLEDGYVDHNNEKERAVATHNEKILDCLATMYDHEFTYNRRFHVREYSSLETEIRMTCVTLQSSLASLAGQVDDGKRIVSDLEESIRSMKQDHRDTLAGVENDCHDDKLWLEEEYKRKCANLNLWMEQENEKMSKFYKSYIQVRQS
jgi:hypothetical protein